MTHLAQSLLSRFALQGSEFTHANEMVRTSGPALLNVKDPAGGTDKLVFDIHEYLDSDDSGTQGSCTTDNVQKFTALNTWLKSVNRCGSRHPCFPTPFRPFLRSRHVSCVWATADSTICFPASGMPL